MEDVLTPNDLLALVETAGTLAERINMDELLQVILEKSGQMTDSPDGAILLYNEERDSLYFAGAIGKNAEMVLERFGEFAEQQVPINNSKAGKVFSSGQSIIIDFIAADPGHYKGVDEETKHATESMVCVPLTAAGKTLGAVQLLNKRSGNYTRRDQVLLEQFASYAAVAIRNASLFEELIAHMGLYASREFSGGVTELMRELNSPARSEKLTVLFADMRGFRLLCQIVNIPDKILEISSQFITMLSEQVLLNGGVVNKFLGDGILALFRNENHAKRAVDCAFAMVKKFSSLRILWDQESNAQLNFLDIGVGITTDTVIIGTMGSSKVHDFTAIGTPVNLAAAFENDARGGRHILVDQPTFFAVKDLVDFEGPVDYELRQPDQRAGHLYKQYYLKRLKAATSHTVFISHSKLDREFIERELIGMLTQNGIEFWYSNEDIEPGSSWVSSINEGLDTCEWVLVVVSQSSVLSGWVKEEVNMAAARPHLRNKIIPLRLDDTKLEDVNPFLRHKQGIDIHNTANYYEKLLSTLKSK